MAHIDFMSHIVGDFFVKIVLPTPAKIIRWIYERSFAPNPRTLNEIYNATSIRDTLINIVFWVLLAILVYSMRKWLFFQP